jgi:hypothetical protein
MEGQRAKIWVTGCLGEDLRNLIGRDSLPMIQIGGCEPIEFGRIEVPKSIRDSNVL